MAPATPSHMERGKIPQPAKRPEEGLAERATRDAIREETRVLLLACASEQQSAMNEGDAEQFVHGLMDEANLESTGYDTHEKKLRAMEQGRDEYAREMVRQATEYGQDAHAAIERALEHKWIGEKEAQQLRMGLKNGSWLETKRFILEELPACLKSWETVHRDRAALIDRALALNLREEDVPELKAVIRSTYVDLPSADRKDAVNRALAALAVWEETHGKVRKPEGPDLQELHEQARGLLEAAAAEGILARTDIGSRLRALFVPNASPPAVQTYLERQLRAELTELRALRAEFDLLEARRQSGHPQSFHFVHAKVFLPWPRSRKQTYLTEARHRLEAAETLHLDILRVQAELDLQNWEEAAALLAQLKPGTLTAEDARRAASLQSYLAAHRPPAPVPEHPPTAEVVADLQDALSRIPSQWVRDMVRHACDQGYDALWALGATLMRRQEEHLARGLTDARAAELRAETDQRAERQARRGLRPQASHETANARSVTYNHHRAAEDVETEEEAAVPEVQVIHLEPERGREFVNQVVIPNTGSRTLLTRTAVIPSGLPYPQHALLARELLPRLKRAVRLLRDRGLTLRQAEAEARLAARAA